MTIRRAQSSDEDGVWQLYQRVAVRPGGIARLEREVDRAYVAGFMSSARSTGLELVAEDDSGRLVGEIHAYSPPLYCFSHVLSDLTIAVDPDVQGQGVGRNLIKKFLDTTLAELPHIQRVELIARESNSAAIALYESLGFRQEGRLEGRILNLDKTVECDIPMAWFSPAATHP